MKDLYLDNFYKLDLYGKSSKKPYNRGKSFGYQVLGFGSGVAAGATTLQRGIFAFGFVSSSGTGVSNLVNTVGVIGTDVSAVGSARFNQAAATFGGDRAIFALGQETTSTRNLTNNLGVVGSDLSCAGTSRGTAAGCEFGGVSAGTAIIAYGESVDGGSNVGMSNKINNVGLVAADVSAVGSDRRNLAACSFGEDKGIFGYGKAGGQTNVTNIVNNLGVIGSDVSGVGSSREGLTATEFGGDQGIFAYGSSHVSNIINNQGVAQSDVSGTGTSRSMAGSAVFGGDQGIIAYGQGPINVRNLINNVGTIAADATGAGTARSNLTGAGFGFS